MRTVIYETGNATFEFPFEDERDRLDFYSSEYNVEEAAELLKFITLQQSQEIRIPEETSYFGFIALDLLSQNKGSALCKTCQRSYQPDQLKLIVVGQGKSPLQPVKLSQDEGICKRILRRRRNPAMHGGKGYECPEGHKLIAMITWMT